MKLRWIWSFVLSVVGAVLMYLPLHSPHFGSNGKDLMFTGGFLLVIASTAITPSTWPHIWSRCFPVEINLQWNFGSDAWQLSLIFFSRG